MPFDCSKCTACCFANGLPLESQNLCNYPPEIQQLLLTIPKGLPNSLTRDGPCVCLNRVTGLCLYPEYKPENCKKFEVGGEQCLRLRARTGITE